MTLLFDTDKHKKFYEENSKQIERRIYKIIKEKLVKEELTDTDKHDLLDLIDRLEWLSNEI